MLIDEIFSKIISGTTRDYYSFETFVLNLLKVHIESQQKKFLTNKSLRDIGDAVAEDGFDDFEGKTLIEIKYNLQRNVGIILYEFVEKIIVNSRKLGYKNVLVISSKNIPDELKERILNTFNSRGEINVSIWGLDEINKIINKHRKKANEIAENIFSLRVENAVSKEFNWDEERNDKIAFLKDAYEKGQFSLFLGAGVSSSAGMPDWNTLLNSLFVSYLTTEFDKQASITDDDIKQIVERLNQIDEPSALMAARYLRKGLSKQTAETKEFTKTITDNLYKLRDVSKKIDSKLITTISKLCMPKRTGAHIKTVITYNFDDLLERQLLAHSIDHHSIYNENENLDPNELPIYHVHGFLPEDITKYEGLEKSTLVFSEEGYHQIYTDAYHWSNLVQLSNLRDNNCLMIGLSLTDPNLRRLLDIAARNIDRPRHYAFMKRMSIEEFAYKKNDDKKEIQVISNLKGAEDFLNRHHKLNEEIMKELGVSIIWFQSFDEIPEILGQVLA